MKKIYLIIISIICLLTFSCSNQENEEFSQSNQKILNAEQDLNFISNKEIENIANVIFSSKNSFFSKGGIKKSINEIKPIGTNHNKPSYYIVNYQGGGFMIMSGDKRALPILAFSENNNFDTNSNGYPSLLVDWLESQDKYITDLRNGLRNDSIVWLKKKIGKSRILNNSYHLLPRTI